METALAGRSARQCQECLQSEAMQIDLGYVRGAVPIEENPDIMFRVAGKKIVADGLATDGEFALIAGSLPMTHVSGRTNMLHVRRLGT
jgi:hypothetical protein